MILKWLLHIVVVDGNLYHSVFFVFEDAVCLFYPAQWEAVGDERCGVYLALLDELQNFLAVASVHAAGLERKVLAIHVG